jgi:hypothetical protein
MTAEYCTIVLGSAEIRCPVDLAQMIGWHVHADGTGRWEPDAEARRLALVTSLAEGRTGEAAVLRALMIHSRRRERHAAQRSAELVAAQERSAAGMEFATERRRSQRESS